MPGDAAPAPSSPREPRAALRTEGLALAAAGGDVARFTELFERVTPALCAWAAARLGARVRVQLEPDDVVQEVWLRALKALPGYDATRGSFRAWLFSVAKFALLDAFRRLPEDVPAGGSPSGRSFDFSAVPAEITTLSRRLCRDEGVRALVARLDRLDPEDRELVLHCGLEGLSTAEAGLLLGLGHEAARKRWQRLRQRLVEQGLPDGLIE